MKRTAQKGMPTLQSFMLRQGRPQQSVASNLHDVVQLIYYDSDLNVVATAFAAFRDIKSEPPVEQRRNPICPNCGKRWDGGFIRPDRAAQKSSE